MIVSGLVRRVRRFVLAAAEVTAATAAATTVAPGYDAAYQEECLTRRRRDHEVGVDILFAKLLGNVQPEGTVVVVDVPLGQVTENGMRSVYLFELVSCFGIVGVLIGVIFEGKFPVCLLDVVCCGGLWQT